MGKDKKKIEKIKKRELKEILKKILEILEKPEEETTTVGHLLEETGDKDDGKIGKIEGELFPKIVEEVEEKIKKEGISEKEVKKIMDELRKANFPRSEKDLREDAIFIWKGELINKIFETRLKEELKKLKKQKKE